tara:strand:- start:271 stop:501 length:231 start_codon:yes stop_codon:yes gene_type:complete
MMPHNYEKIKKFNLFKEEKAPGSKRPDYGNSKVIFDVPLEPGRYSFSGWQYEDTGNISLEIQKVTEIEGSGGGFDD